MNAVAIDPWDPAYGYAANAGALVDSEVPTDIDVELAEADWAPLAPDPSVPRWPAVVFVDGVQRADAIAWVTGADGVTHQGRCVSVAAGAVRCDGRAVVIEARTARVLVAPETGAGDLVTRHGTWRHMAVVSDDPLVLDRAVARARGDLEAGVAADAAVAGEVVVVDGPLSQHRHLHGAIGYVKTLQRAYGPAVVLDTARRLGAGERSPVFLVGESAPRWSWYVRLPGTVSHPLAGVIRCELSTRAQRDEAVVAADRTALALPRFASVPHKDPRAPQNLHPIAGLERELRRRLGDAALLLRALRAATAA